MLGKREAGTGDPMLEKEHAHFKHTSALAAEMCGGLDFIQVIASEAPGTNNPTRYLT